MAIIAQAPHPHKKLAAYSEMRNNLSRFNIRGQGHESRSTGRVLDVDRKRDIQKAVDIVASEGGGIVRLRAGTYTLTADINLPGGVTIQGISRDNVIIECGAYTINILGTDAYTTGTVAITNGSTTVTGTGTTFTSAMVGQYIRLYDDYYEITAFSSTTSITIGSAFAANDITGAGFAVADLNYNAVVSKLTIQNSSAGGIDCAYAYEPIFDDIVVAGCATGMDLDHVIAPRMLAFLTENDINLDQNHVYSFKVDFCAFVDSAVGAGVVMTNCANSTFFDSTLAGNATNGMTLTNCSDIAFISISSQANGAIGIELASGCNDNQFTHLALDGNTTDNFKITATSDRNTINDCSVKNAGAWGINIAASTCDNNIVGDSVSFESNTSGNITDSGTSTSLPIKTIRAVKASDETVNNSATLQDDDDLKFQIGANEKWGFDILVQVDPETATPDFKFGFTVPSGATGAFQVQHRFGTASDGEGVGTIGTATGALNTNSTNENLSLIRGFVVNGANAGTVQFQWAQATATAEDTVMKAGSYIVATRLTN